MNNINLHLFVLLAMPLKKIFLQGPAAFRPRAQLLVSVGPNVSTLQYKTEAITLKEYLMKCTGNELQQEEGPDKTPK